jgi:hypothetical protein
LANIASKANNRCNVDNFSLHFYIKIHTLQQLFRTYTRQIQT